MLFSSETVLFACFVFTHQSWFWSNYNLFSFERDVLKCCYFYINFFFFLLHFKIDQVIGQVFVKLIVFIHKR